MKRFITVASRQAEEVWQIIRNNAAASFGTGVGVGAYTWLVQKLNEKRIGHHDQKANNTNELPQKSGYVTFYVDANGQWQKVEHS